MHRGGPDAKTTGGSIGSTGSSGGSPGFPEGRRPRRTLVHGCNVVERVPPTAAANGVPSFVAIAARPSTTAASLNWFLSSPHAQMGDFSLSPEERQALVDYILSLR